jgi:hypothetical protein
MKGNFTQISNELMRCTNLTPAEKSLLVILYGLPKTFVIRKEILHKLFGFGVTQLDTAWKGLKKKGFITSKQLPKNGKQNNWKHTINLTPIGFTPLCFTPVQNIPIKEDCNPGNILNKNINSSQDTASQGIADIDIEKAFREINNILNK